MLSIGVDFGTTNSSVAVYDGTSLRLLDLDPFAPDPRVMRSLIYFERGGDVYCGREALDRYLQQNMGRAVRYEYRRIGEVSMTFAEIGTMVKDAFALIDVNEPGRLFQSLKRFLPVAHFQATNVFGRDCSVEELLSLLARAIVDAVERETGLYVDELTVGWPVRFSEDEAAEQIARQRAREAWRLMGIPKVRFVEEPVGAIRHFATTNDLTDVRHILVFDFGGGTLDVCIGRVVEGAVDVLATNGVPMGGDLIDSRIVAAELTPLFGEHARYRHNGLPLPRSLFNKLHSWQELAELNKPEPLELIRRAVRDTNQPRQLAALEALVSKNYGIAFFQAVERAKVLLSSRNDAFVQLTNRDLQIEHEITRPTFEAIIGPQVRTARACAVDAVAKAGLEVEDIDLVLTTGGSSLIPAFRRMLQDALPMARLQDSDAFTSVAAGLAIDGYRG